MVGEVFRLNVSFFWGGGRKNVLYMNFCLWSRRLLSNVSWLRLVSMVVTDPGCLER